MPSKARDDDLVMRLVDLALTRPTDQRETYLRSACGDDTEVFDQTWTYVKWEERMNGFLLDPLYPAASYEHSFDPGELLDGRFRIVREIAQGGMGVVYEAVDEKLQRRIALKCAKAGFRRRLPPEVRNASDISHPNVCKIFEIHTASTNQGEIDFITMEFLDGETLAARLIRGPLPDKEARAIALQLCAGLAEAHRTQVIHGDLKSNNVILTTTADGAIRAVITDFGLARRPETSQVFATSGRMVGTPDYMAPELWKGDKVSAASDIFALGVILSELGSGRLPKSVIARCRNHDPARRFASADDVARALVPLRSRRWFLATAAAIVVAAVTGLVTYERATAPKEVVRLAMLPFSYSGDLGPIAESVTRETSANLARLNGGPKARYSAISLAEVQRANVDTAEKARSLLGATHVLHGTLRKENEQVIVAAYLTDARSRVNANQWKAEYAPGQVRYVPVALAGLVTGTLRLPPLVTAATVNAAAKQDYWKGLSYMRRNSGADAALSLLEAAVAADPDSPLTYAAVAEAQQLKFFLTSDGAWLERAKLSVRQAEARNPDLAPVHRIAGVLMFREGRYELAAGECLRAIELDPKNGEAHRRLGQAYEASNQLGEALTEYRRAVDLDPEDYRNQQQLGAFYYQRADYAEAMPYFAKIVELAPEEPGTHYVLGGNGYLSLGRLPEAEYELRLAIRLGETPSELHTLGVVLMDEGRYAEGAESILRAVTLGPDRLVCWMNLGTVYRLMNREPESQKAYRRALDVAQREILLDPRNGKTRSYLAFVCARLGDQKRAESEIGQALLMSPNDADVRFMAATTYEALDRREDALNLLSTAPSGVLADLSRWPDAAALAHDPRFVNLFASHQSNQSK